MRSVLRLLPLSALAGALVLVGLPTRAAAPSPAPGPEGRSDEQGVPHWKLAESNADASRLAAEDETAPPRAFTWARSAVDLGAVAPPAQPGIDGWQTGPTNTLYRSVPSFTGDPTYEVLLLPPGSGHPSRPERFLLQFPADLLQRPLEDRAAVVALHGFQQSEKSIFLNTELPWECSARGWVLIAPYGLTDTHFGNVRSQTALEACVRVVHRAVPFNHRRVYAVGFSMGGLAALSFGMRHLDPLGLRLAGVAVHTAPLDLLRAWENASPPLQERLADELHFGATPAQDPFAWERVSPVRFLANGLVDPEHAPVENLLHVPVLLHANLADPLPHLVEGVQELKNHLLLRGATVEESLVFEPEGGHAWGTMDFRATLDFLSAQGLGGLPDRSDLACDRTGAWLGTELRGMETDAHARYRLERAPEEIEHTNALALTATERVDELRLDLPAYGIDPAQPFGLLHASADGTVDVLVLGGYAEPPASVLVDGALPHRLGHDVDRGELLVVPTRDGRAVRVDVTP